MPALLTKNKPILQGSSTQIMGIINITENSFYDGGRFILPQEAIKQAQKLVDEGAHILDFGAESSRSHSLPLDENCELERIETVLSLLPSFPHIQISVDTSRFRVAQKALTLGATLINDIYAFRRDPELASLIADQDCQVILMHMQGNPFMMQDHPHYENVVDEILSFFEERIHYALNEGIQENQIILDPGIGFGKSQAHNGTILSNLHRLKALGFPLLVGPSRKSFIGNILGKPPQERLFGTAAVVAHLVFQGIDIIRLHDVLEMQDVISVAEFLSSCSKNEEKS